MGAKPGRRPKPTTDDPRVRDIVEAYRLLEILEHYRLDRGWSMHKLAIAMSRVGIDIPHKTLSTALQRRRVSKRVAHQIERFLDVHCVDRRTVDAPAPFEARVL